MNRLLALSAWLSVTCMVGPGTPAPTIEAEPEPGVAAAPTRRPVQRTRRAVPCRVIGAITVPGAGANRRVVVHSTSERWTDAARESDGEVAPPAWTLDEALARGAVPEGDRFVLALEPGQNRWSYRFDGDGRALEARIVATDGRVYAYAFTYACVSPAAATRATASTSLQLRTMGTQPGPRAGERVSVLFADTSVDAWVDDATSRPRAVARLSIAAHRLPASATELGRGRKPAELAIVHPADGRASLVDPRAHADLPVDAARIRFAVDLEGDGEPDVLLARERNGCALELRREPDGWHQTDRDCG